MIDSVASHDRRRPRRTREAAARARSYLPRLAVLVMLPILGYALFLAGGKYLQMVKLHQDLQVVRAELDAEKRLNIKLQEELAEARSDTHIEAVARRDLGLIKSGDHAIVLSSTGARPTPTPMPAVEPGRNDQSLPPFLSWLLDRLGQ